MHSTVPVGFPPSHAICTELALDSAFVFVSALAMTSKDSTNLPLLDPQSSPNILASCCEFSFRSNELFSSSFPKSNVIFHLPGDHGEGDVRCDDDDSGEDDIAIRVDTHVSDRVVFDDGLNLLRMSLCSLVFIIELRG